jgi:Putative zinc-finger
MNCQEAQTQLSEYLESSLDALRMKSIETHLLGCPVCRAEVEGLAECIQEIARLPIVDPPMGFAQRVMAHARAIEIKSSPWQKIFAPIRFAVPMQASAAVLIAVFAVLLYQNQSRFKNNPPTESTAPTLTSPALLQQNDNTGDNAARSTAPSPSVEPKAKLDVERKVQTARQARGKSALDFPSSKNTAPVAPQSTAKTEAENVVAELRDVPHRAPIQAQEVATGRESLRSAGDPFGFGTTFSAPFRGIFAPERALSPLTEPSADVEFVVRRREAQSREPKEAAGSDALRRRAEADSGATAAVAKRADAPATPQPSSMTEVRWFTVRAEHYDQFKKELAAEAAIDSERPIGSMMSELGTKSNRELLIKVIILTPTER